MYGITVVSPNGFQGSEVAFWEGGGRGRIEGAARLVHLAPAPVVELE